MEAKLLQLMNSVSICKKNLFISNHGPLQKPLAQSFCSEQTSSCQLLQERKSYSLDSWQWVQYRLTTAQSTPLKQHVCSLFAIWKSEKYNFLWVHRGISQQNDNSLDVVEILQFVGVMKLQMNRKSPVKTIKKPSCCLMEPQSVTTLGYCR